MKKTMMALAAVAILATTGCSSLTDYSKYQAPRDVDCTALYVTKTFSDVAYKVKISQVRVDRFGNTWVRPRSNLDVQFYGGWQRPEQLVNYQCKGEVNELRDQISSS